MKYDKLFQPGKIGKLALKNRIVMPAMGVNYASFNGEASDIIIDYYEERAKNDCGLIITEIMRIDEEYGVGISNQLSATSGKHIPKLEELAKTIHQYDTKIFAQLHHPGRQTHSRLIGGKQIVAPSAIMCKFTNEMPRALTTEECEGLVKKFITGAVIVQTAGFDGVELHGAHGYLINQFLSPYTNHRTDKYGGSFTNRMRFISEIITGIKYMCGPNFPISVRIDGDEFVENGIKIEEAVKIARTLESYGVDAINVSKGIYETGTTIVEPNSYPEGWAKHLAKAVKKAVHIPVIAVNTIKNPSFAEQMLDEGVCDFVGVGRGSLADSAWAKKAEEGNDIAIRKCLGCLYCFESLSKGQKVKCAINPRLGSEGRYAGYNANGDGKTVVVVGGGPAGMQAAIVLAKRNYNVYLIEKGKELGGTLHVADKQLYKQRITDLVETLKYEVSQLDITVLLETEATVELVESYKPYGVIVATGGVPITPNILGIHNDNVVTCQDYLTGKATVGQKVAIVGSGLTGIETAEVLAEKGHDIAIIEMAKEIAPGVYKSIVADIMARLNKYNPDIYLQNQLIGITDEGALLEDTKMSSQIKTTVKADTILLAIGTTPDTMDIEAYKKTFDKVCVIGDSVRGSNVAQAISHGFTKAYVF